MSAFLVSKAHIDALVQLVAVGPGSCFQWHPWLGPEAHERGLQYDVDALGALLWLENLASVTARYPQDADGDRCGPTGLRDGEIAAYAYRRPARRLTIVEAFKVIDCYCYQSCEHSAWELSTALTICQGIRSALWHALPGYDEAAWEISA
jgi:hypothetical protein